MILPLSIAHLVALGVLKLVIILLFISPPWAALPLGLYVLFCAFAPLFPRFGFFLPILSRGSRKQPRVALSFDDGPDPEVTPRVLDLLDQHGVKAAFFLIGEKAQAHPELVREILRRGHEVGNHSWHHFPFLMLKGRRTLRQEIAKGQEILKTFGILPVAFRPPVGVTSPALWRILIEEGMFCLNFSRRAGDMGNRRIRNLAARLLDKVRPGDLLLLHDVRPPEGGTDYLLQEFEAVLAGLKARQLEVVPVSTLVGRQIMKREAVSGSAAEAFYDDLAATYDHEQFETGVSLARRTEQALFEARLPALLRGGERVLEIGAGTGIFTLPIAAKAGEVLAVDISRNMLNLLEAKARAAGVLNIRTLAANVEESPLEGPFDLVCAFSALEYMKDLSSLIQRLGPQMAPGGRIYLLTARRSLFRFFTQMGNAMRQGLWLRARSRREMTRMLEAAGFEVVSIKGHLLRCLISGGMLLEVEARWPDAGD
ncbi:MAG: polysaccharide deacetylase [Holophagaceae bacterium]|nr:polysaccharide deacetylase [Holophagaceae bacterium]